MEPENIGENNTKPAICPHDLSLHNLMVAQILPYYASFEWERKWLAFRSRHYFLLYPYFPFFSRERASVLAEKKIIVLYVGRQIFLQEEKFLTSDRPVNQRKLLFLSHSKEIFSCEKRNVITYRSEGNVEQEKKHISCVISNGSLVSVWPILLLLLLSWPKISERGNAHCWCINFAYWACTHAHALFPNIVKQKEKACAVVVWEVTYDLRMRKKEVGKCTVVEKNSEQWKYGRQEILATLGISPVPISSLNGPRSKTQRDRAQKLYFCHFHIDPPFVWRCEFIGSSCQVTQWQKTLFYFGANLGLMHIYPTRLSLPPSAPK